MLLKSAFPTPNKRLHYRSSVQAPFVEQYYLTVGRIQTAFWSNKMRLAVGAARMKGRTNCTRHFRVFLTQELLFSSRKGVK
jgi:hypothetical protein